MCVLKRIAAGPFRTDVRKYNHNGAYPHDYYLGDKLLDILLEKSICWQDFSMQTNESKVNNVSTGVE